jgi:hypothetical protein
MKNDMYFVYETTNLINNKKYRGIHKTSNIDDGYLGSGLVLLLSVNKYGKENFTREILEYCNSYDELIEKEKLYVDENWVKDPLTYNLKTGGQSAGILSDESKNKISETLKRKYESGEIIAVGWNTGISPTEEVKRKISDTLKEKYKNKEHPSKGKTKSSASWKVGNIPWNKGKKLDPNSEESNKKRSDTMKDWLNNNEHPRKGKEPWNKGKKCPQIGQKRIGIEMEKFECPHCGIFVNKGNLTRWYFDNCKNKKSTE